MVQENRGEYPPLWACIESIAPNIGCVPQTLNDWVKQQEIDTGIWPKPNTCCNPTA
jgi:transposase